VRNVEYYSLTKPDFEKKIVDETKSGK